MCGFSIITNRAQPGAGYRFGSEHLRRRGPDQYSFVETDFACFEFARLNMVSDDHVGMQPFKISDGKFLFFNGEIYGWQKTIEGYGDVGSDTEYIAWKIKEIGLEGACKAVDGMFALCIVDLQNKKVSVARDFPGIKPIYYTIGNAGLCVSSNVNDVRDCIGAELDDEQINYVKYFRHPKKGRTIFQNINSVEPGAIIEFDLSQEDLIVDNKSFFSIVNQFGSQKYQKQTLESLLQKVISEQGNSIYEPTCLLSSGIDSGLIAHFLRSKFGRTNAYSVSFKDKNCDESHQIKEFWQGKADLNFVEDEYEEKDQALLEEYALFKGGPVTIGNEISLLKIFEKIKSDTSLVLAGEGADELFLGYDRLALKFRGLSESSNPKADLQQIILTYNYALSDEQLSVKIAAEVSTDVLGVLETWDWVKAYQYFMLTYHLPALLDRLDKTSMFFSVEARVPFLSTKILSYVLRSDISDQVFCGSDGTLGKKALRDIAVEHTNVAFAYAKKIGFPHPKMSGKRDEFGEQKNGWILEQVEKYRQYLHAANSR